jgi:hypothetical protein
MTHAQSAGHGVRAGWIFFVAGVATCVGVPPLWTGLQENGAVAVPYKRGIQVLQGMLSEYFGGPTSVAWRAFLSKIEKAATAKARPGNTSVWVDQVGSCRWGGVHGSRLQFCWVSWVWAGLEAQLRGWRWLGGTTSKLRGAFLPCAPCRRSC